MINLDLTGKRAVVTGASLGIGEATVKNVSRTWGRCFFLCKNT